MSRSYREIREMENNFKLHSRFKKVCGINASNHNQQGEI